MKICITGATGFIGNRFTHHLAELGYDVKASVRNPGQTILFSHERIVPVAVDLADMSSLGDLISECHVCFHLAALARSWSPNASDFYRINVKGTRNVFQAAMEQGVQRVVFVSTAGIFGGGPPDRPVTESSLPAKQLDTLYEQSKRDCEPVVQEFRDQGLDILTVYPTRVYGPGRLSQSNAVTRIMDQFDRGRWRWIPGDGNAAGNYVFIDDILTAMTAAIDYMGHHRRLLLGGDNLTFLQMVQLLRSATGQAHRMYRIPGWVIRSAARLTAMKRAFGGQPQLTVAVVNKYLKDWYCDAGLAMRELNYNPTPANDGFKQTIEWLRRHRR